MSPMKCTRPRVMLAIGAVLVFGLAACGGQGAEGEGPIRIGASLPLTGQFSIPGAKHRDGYQYCAKVINDRGGLMGRRVELLVRDNRSDTETAVSQYERFINVDDVDLVFGTFSSLLTFPSSAVTERNQMILPVPSGGALEIWARGYKHIFYFQQLPAEYTGKSPINTLVTYRDEGVIPADEFPKTAAVVHTDDFFANGIAAGLLGRDVEVPGREPISLAPGALADAGIKPVLQEKWPEGFNNWISLANKIRSSKAELLLVGTASPDEAINLVNALKTVNYKPKMVYMSQGTQSEFQENLGEAANGIMSHSTWHPQAQWEGTLAGKPFSNADFVDGFKKAYNRPPDEDEAIPFAVCQGMAQAVEATEGTDNQEIREWLSSRTEGDPVRTILGPFNWDDRGLTVGRDFVMTQWQDGELKFVYPRDEFPGVSELVFPKPAW
ncbi:MAG: ABC transporter substrate-binding protein [Streptosporangiales bacterium]|nr:ABC transporter substrate-binding protein [Streptosporangiales bacterium]